MPFLQELAAIQREIYTAFAGLIGDVAETGDWSAFLAYLPLGIVFGAVHALTPGHSKAVLATYLAGSTAALPRALLVSMALSFTHVGMSILIVLLSLPLVSVALGNVGQAPLLEDLSRGLLGLIGAWMVWQGLRGRHARPASEGAIVGVLAGLVPCPLTLFVMTLAITRGVPAAGLGFAATMLVGIATTLSLVALATVLFRENALALFEQRPRLVDRAARSAQVIAGLALVLVGMTKLAA